MMMNIGSLEWAENDGKVLKAKVKSPTNLNCGVDFPLIADYLTFMKREEIKDGDK